MDAHTYLRLAHQKPTDFLVAIHDDVQPAHHCVVCDEGPGCCATLGVTDVELVHVARLPTGSRS